MRKLLIPVLLFYSLSFAQQDPQIKIPIKAVNGPNYMMLPVGLDPLATDCIDPYFNEVYNLPYPPAGAFDACYHLSYNCSPNIMALKDYRHADFPFTGTTEHKIAWQLATGVPTFAIEYELPPNCRMIIKDPLGGVIFHSDTLTGTGTYNMPAPSFNQALLIMTYNNITPPAPVFTTFPDSISFYSTEINNTQIADGSVKNSGTSPLIIYSITSSDSQFAYYKNHIYQGWSFPVTIAPGTSKPLLLLFTPSSLGNKSGSLIFTHNAGTSHYRLKGTCIPFSSPIVPKVLDFITISDQTGVSKSLPFGLDPNATDGIDTQFGENYIPPIPPTGFMDARFFLPEDNFSGATSSWRDFRNMPTSPFSGTKEFRLAYSSGELNPGFKISWNFPPYLSCLLQDVFGGVLINTTAAGIGYFIDTLGLGKLKMFATYTGVLPVELTTFTANVNGDKVVLNWQTASEKNNKGFDIERRAVNSDWSPISFIPGAGTSTTVNSYSYNDNQLPPGSYTYMLKQRNYDGTFNYSKEVTAEVIQSDHFVLSQNYPNPFNPSTVIKFTVPKTSLVKVAVYDVLGNEVKTLFNESVPAGAYSASWNGFSNSGQQMSSGIYIYKITAGEYQQSKKMVLIK